MVILGVGGNLAGFDFFAVMAVALAITAVGVIVDKHYAKQQSAILWEIQRMAAISPNCPSCGKDVPQGNFEFCPFCGAPLKE